MSHSSKGSSKTARNARVQRDLEVTPPETDEERTQRLAELARLRGETPEGQGAATAEPQGDTETKQRHRQPRAFTGAKADPYAVGHRHGGRISRTPDLR